MRMILANGPLVLVCCGMRDNVYMNLIKWAANCPVTAWTSSSFSSDVIIPSARGYIKHRQSVATIQERLSSTRLGDQLLAESRSQKLPIHTLSSCPQQQDSGILRPGSSPHRDWQTGTSWIYWLVVSTLVRSRPTARLILHLVPRIRVQHIDFFGRVRCGGTGPVYSSPTEYNYIMQSSLFPQISKFKKTASKRFFLSKPARLL